MLYDFKLFSRIQHITFIYVSYLKKKSLIVVRKRGTRISLFAAMRKNEKKKSKWEWNDISTTVCRYDIFYSYNVASNIAKC